MSAVGVPFFCMSIAVGLSLALPGFKSDMTKGILGALPQVCTLLFASEFLPIYPGTPSHVLDYTEIPDTHLKPGD